jgi:hypothetical protein
MALEAALMAAKVSIHDPHENGDGPGLLSPGLTATSGEGGGGGGELANGGGGGGAGAQYRARVAAVSAFVKEHRVRELHAAGQPLAAEVASELQELVGACVDSCSAVLDVNSPEALWPLGSAERAGAAAAAGGGGGGEGGGEGSGKVPDKQRWLQVRAAAAPRAGGPAPAPTAPPPLVQPNRSALAIACTLQPRPPRFPPQPLPQVLADISLADDQMRELLRLRSQLLEGLGRCLSERRALAERILTGGWGWVGGAGSGGAARRDAMGGAARPDALRAAADGRPAPCLPRARRRPRRRAAPRAARQQQRARAWRGHAADARGPAARRRGGPAAGRVL